MYRKFTKMRENFMENWVVKMLYQMKVDGKLHEYQM